MPRSAYHSSRAVAPVLVPFAARLGRHEELDFHLLELAGAEDPVLRRDLVPEALADLGDAERRLLAGGLQHLSEVGEHALGGLGAQVRVGPGALDRTGLGLEHQVELAGLGEAVLRVAFGHVVGIVELVEAEAVLALRAVDQRVGEVVEVARGLPHLGRAEMAASMSTTSSRCCTIDRTQASLTLRNNRTRGGRSRTSSGNRRRSPPTGTRNPALAEVDHRPVEFGGGHRPHRLPPPPPPPWSVYRADQCRVAQCVRTWPRP